MDIKDVADIAQEYACSEGEFPMVLIVEGTNGVHPFKLGDVPNDPKRKCTYMHMVGMTLSTKSEVGSVRRVFLLFPVWMSWGPANMRPAMPPSRDPHRQEALLVSSLDLVTKKTEALIFGVQRDPHGQVIAFHDLANTLPQGQPFESPLLDALAFGIEAGTAPYSS